MRAVPRMTTDQLRATLSLYTRGILELTQRYRELRDVPIAGLIEAAIGALDKVRSLLIEPTADPDDDPLHFVAFALGREARDILALALVRCAELAPGSSRSVLVSLMALDFLATNDFKFANEEQRIRFLAKYEKLMGLKLVVVDPEAEEIVYGMGTLERLARSASDTSPRRVGLPDQVAFDPEVGK